MAKVWAHRGASAYAPENTLPSFQRAVDLGADGIELDVQLSADGEMVVIHDETLDRTTTGAGPVGARTLAELKALDASMGQDGYAGVTIPTLAEVLDLITPTSLEVNIEIKDSVVAYPGLTEKVLALVDERHLDHRVLISTFNHCTLAHLRRIGSLLRTGILFQDILFEPWNYATQIWATSLHPHRLYLDYVDNLIPESHAAGLDVYVWSVDTQDDLRHVFDQGADGVFTDYPDRALRVQGRG